MITSDTKILLILLTFVVDYIRGNVLEILQYIYCPMIPIVYEAWNDAAWAMTSLSYLTVVLFVSVFIYKSCTRIIDYVLFVIWSGVWMVMGMQDFYQELCGTNTVLEQHELRNFLIGITITTIIARVEWHYKNKNLPKQHYE